MQGKKIRISGFVTIERGLNNIPKEYDSSGREIIKQGRAGDTPHIVKPVIEIVN